MASADKTGILHDSPGDIATRSGALPHTGLSLLGVFGPADDLAALVRAPGGTIRRVTTGQKISAGRIVGIDENGLILEKNGRTRRLALPSG